jgi:hypothetical protein
MKKILTILFAAIMTVLAYGQTNTIIVENIVKFYKYNDKTYSNVDAIDFILKVTNHTKKPIPDLGVTNRSEYVTFYINGQIDNPLSLFNGFESTDGVKTIAIDSTQTFDSGGWLLTTDSGLFMKYGNEFTVQWEYIKIKSKIIKVNIKNKTIETIDQ